MKKTIKLLLNSSTGGLEFACAEDVKILDKKTLSLITSYTMHDASANEKDAIDALMRKRKFNFDFAVI